MRGSLRLIQNGWPPDTAFALDPFYRLAFCIALGEMDGGEFDWQTQTWKAPK